VDPYRDEKPQPVRVADDIHGVIGQRGLVRAEPPEDGGRRFRAIRHLSRQAFTVCLLPEVVGTWSVIGLPFSEWH
jgi:hypothetical protein